MNPPTSTHPLPYWIRPSCKVLRPKAEDDHHSHVSEESTDQNPPHDSDLDEDELLGPATDVSGLPERGRPLSAVSVALLVDP